MSDSQKGISLEERLKNTTALLGAYIKDLKNRELDARISLADIIQYLPVQIISILILLYTQNEVIEFIALLLLLFTFIIQFFKLQAVCVLIATNLIVRTRDISETLRELDLKNELKEAKSAKQRSVIMNRKHYLYLEKYYRQSLSQSSQIFYFGIFIALFGIFTIPFILYFEFENAVILSTIQAILTVFVLVIFQTMYTKTNNSVNTFYGGLMDTYKYHDNILTQSENEK